MSFDVINLIVLPNLNINTLLGYHLFTAIEFTFYLLIFREILSGNFIRQLISWMIPLVWVFKLIDITYITGTDQFDNVAITIQALTCIILCICFFHQTLQQLRIGRLECYPPFWICAGILVYFSGSLFIFLFSTYIVNQGNSFYFLHWSLHTFFSLLKYVAFSIGLWWTSPTLKTYPS